MFQNKRSNRRPTRGERKLSIFNHEPKRVTDRIDSQNMILSFCEMCHSSQLINQSGLKIFNEHSEHENNLFGNPLDVDADINSFELNFEM